MRFVLLIAAFLFAAPTHAAVSVDSAAAALARASLLEQAGELVAARRAAQKAVAMGGGYAADVHAGWLSYRLGELDVALGHYQAARTAVPDGEEALLGETLVLALREDWPALREAAKALVGHHPTQSWGWVRLGLAALQQGEPEVARAAYRKALDVAPDLAEAYLGLGFVARSEGDGDAARALCRKAAPSLAEDDPRLAACLAPMRSTLTVTPSAWALVAGYTDYYTRNFVWSVAAETELRWANGFGGFVGVAVSRTRMRFETSDFTQVMPGAGVSYAWEDGLVGVGYLLAWQDGTDARTEHLAALEGRWWHGRWGVGADVAALVAPSEEVLLQGGVPLSWGRPDDVVGLTLTPTIQYWPQGADDLEGTFYVSGALAVAWRPMPWLSLEAGGWYGRRRSYAEPGGRFVWNSDDVLQGGARLDAAFHVAAPVWVTLRLRDDFGIEQGGRAYDFQLLTGQVGLAFVL